MAGCAWYLRQCCQNCTETCRSKLIIKSIICRIVPLLVLVVNVNQFTVLGMNSMKIIWNKLNCRRITDYKLRTEHSLNLNVTHIYKYSTVKLRCQIHENEIYYCVHVIMFLYVFYIDWWRLERVCSQTQLCQLRCLMTILDNYMFRPLLAIFRLSLRELTVLLYKVRARGGENSTSGLRNS